jgi:Pyruvate/2-oxoacid:ferredoxin oxidoreductase gamma subunit
VLGAYIAASKVVSLDTAEHIIRQEFKSKPQFVELNISALRKGAETALSQLEMQ